MNNEPKIISGWPEFRDQPWIRVSALNDFVRCPRRYFYRYGIGLISREPRIALHFGEAIHAGLGWMLEHQGDTTGAMERFLNVWSPINKEGVADTSLEQMGDEKRNTFGALRIFQTWANKWRMGQQIYEPIKPPSGIPRSVIKMKESISIMEVPFTMDFGLPLVLCGRIDGLSIHKSTREMWTNEFKTTSDSSPRFYEGFEFNAQMFSYAVACRSWGLDVKGCFVEGFEVKKPLKTKATPDPEIRIQPVLFHEHLLEDHLYFIREQIQRLCNYIEKKDFPKWFTGCNPYSQFGQPGYNCDYRYLCLSPDWTTNKPLFKVEDDNLFVQPTISGKEI